MRNYNTYLTGMEKGNSEKLFFLDHINLDGFDKVIDFGCGKGDILKACADGKKTLIGIDLDPVMIDYAKKNVPNAQFYPKLTRSMLDGKTLIIFSSVLHEVEEYWTELEKILKGTHATVVVRDMRFTGLDGKIDKSELSKIVDNSHPRMLAEFIARYGLTTIKQMYHWLLKYSYVDNWDLELKENYFSFNYDKLFSLGKVVYENNYTLPFKKRKVLQDYQIYLSCGTHTQLIIQLD